MDRIGISGISGMNVVPTLNNEKDKWLEQHSGDSYLYNNRNILEFTFLFKDWSVSGPYL